MEIRLQGFPRNLHPNPQPSAKRDIAALKGRLRAVPSAQSKKEPRRGSFSLHGNPYWRMEIRLAPDFDKSASDCGSPAAAAQKSMQPSAKRDIAASKGRHGLCLRRRTKKSRDAALFLCAGILIDVWKYGSRRISSNLHLNAAARREHLIRRDKLGTFPHWGRQRMTSISIPCAEFCCFDSVTSTTSYTI